MATADASQTGLVWFKRDLRLTDNPALHAAVRSGRPLILLYIRDDDRAISLSPGRASDWWLHQSLDALTSQLGRAGGDLILRSGKAEAVISEICRDYDVAEVFWNQSELPWIDDRDRAIAHTLVDQKIKPRVFRSSILLDHARVLTKSETPFKVFSAFWRAASRDFSPADPLPAPDHLSTLDGVASDRLADWSLCPENPNWASAFPEHWTPGEDGARARLKLFLDAAVNRYAEHRDRPDIDGTSRLSAHLAFGEISPRLVWHALSTALEAGASQEQVDKYRAELGWREFAYYLFHHFGDLRRKNFNPAFDAFPWREDAEALRRWRFGQTGIPMVDAGMRQLYGSGWMHNRVRMITGSYLVKHLGLHWKDGMAWFEDTLVDADPVVNAVSWQWVAGSGADAAPYFRIFNPVSQGEKFDPAGDYVRNWVSEINRLPKASIHQPWMAPPLTAIEAGLRLGETYPEPLIDLKEGRQRALDSYAIAKETHAAKKV